MTFILEWCRREGWPVDAARSGACEDLQVGTTRGAEGVGLSPAGTGRERVFPIRVRARRTAEGKEQQGPRETGRDWVPHPQPDGCAWQAELRRSDVVNDGPASGPTRAQTQSCNNAVLRPKPSPCGNGLARRCGIRRDSSLVVQLDSKFRLASNRCSDRPLTTLPDYRLPHQRPSRNTSEPRTSGSAETTEPTESNAYPRYAKSEDYYWGNSAIM